ncbi:MAG: ankyrin repeat domain-containing protein [Rhodobacteraceae bacterium]|nr:ankyrin repeat domain-containing protein [Paracoccaceae bacterium]
MSRIAFIAAAVLAAIVVATAARANDCNWEEEGFWEQQDQSGRVAACIAAGADIEARDKNGVTPLHRAAEHGTPDVVRALIAAGADIEARDKLDWTPLHLAAFWGTLDVVRTLIDAGANVRARSKNGNLPVDFAEDNEAVRNDPVFQVLNKARFD